MALVPRWNLSWGWRVAWNVVSAVSTAVGGTLVALDRKLAPTTWKWIHNESLQIFALIGLVVLPFFDAVRRAVLRSTATREERVRVEARNILSAALVTAAETTGVSVSDVGMGLFFVRPRGVRRPESLVRVERVRIPDDLHESGAVFVRGKGAVGSCWELRRIVHQNMTSINARYTKPEDIASRWSNMRPETTKNFTQAEFTAIVGKYAEVLAVPVMDSGGKFVGCIALDRRDRNDPDKRCYFDDEAIKKILGAAATTVLATYKK